MWLQFVDNRIYAYFQSADGRRATVPLSSKMHAHWEYDMCVSAYIVSLRYSCASIVNRCKHTAEKSYGRARLSPASRADPSVTQSRRRSHQAETPPPPSPAGHQTRVIRFCVRWRGWAYARWARFPSSTAATGPHRSARLEISPQSSWPWPDAIFFFFYRRASNGYRHAHAYPYNAQRSRHTSIRQLMYIVVGTRYTHLPACACIPWTVYKNTMCSNITISCAQKKKKKRSLVVSLHFRSENNARRRYSPPRTLLILDTCNAHAEVPTTLNIVSTVC